MSDLAAMESLSKRLREYSADDLFPNDYQKSILLMLAKDAEFIESQLSEARALLKYVSVNVDKAIVCDGDLDEIMDIESVNSMLVDFHDKLTNFNKGEG